MNFQDSNEAKAERLAIEAERRTISARNLNFDDKFEKYFIKQSLILSTGSIFDIL